MVVFQNLVNGLFGDNALVADFLRRALSQHNARDAQKRVLKGLLVGLPAVLNLIVKPTHCYSPPYSLATSSA